MKEALLIGGLAAGGLFALVVYRRAQAAAAPSAYVPSARCKAARVVAAAYGRTITDAQCELADKVDDKIGIGAVIEWLKPAIPSWVQWADKDAKNKSLNGAVAVALTDEIRGITTQFKPDGASPGALLMGSVLRFENGGVPFAAHADFSKCAPGTADMTAPGNAGDRFRNVVAGTRPTSQQLYDALGRGAGGTPVPFTNVAAWTKIGVDWSLTPHIGQLLTGSGYDPATSIQLGIVAGVKHVCPAGQVLIEVIPVVDHRGDGSTVASSIIKRCGTPGAAPTSGPAEGYGAPGVNYVPGGGPGTSSSTSYTAPPGAPPPGFHWVQATATTAAHWERDR